MTYAEAMRRYGVDKPDVRFGMELQDLSDEFAETDFAPFASVVENGGEIKCIVAKGCADYSRKDARRASGIRKTLWRRRFGVDQKSEMKQRRRF